MRAVFVWECSLGCVPVYGCVYFFSLCQHSGLTESCKWKDRAILLAVCLARFPPVALSVWLSIRASDWDALTAPLSHQQRGRMADWWPGQGQEVWAGGRIPANLEKKKKCVDLSLCVCSKTQREDVWLCVEVWWVWMCMHVWQEEKMTPSAIPVCWLLWFVVLRLYVPWIVLKLQPVFPRGKRKKKILLCDMAKVWERGGHSGPTLLINYNNMFLMSSWSLRNAGGRVLLRGKQQSYKPSLGFMCYSFRQGTGSAKFVSMIKCFLNFMTPTATSFEAA